MANPFPQIRPLDLPNAIPATPIDFRPLSDIGNTVGEYRRKQQIADVLSQATDAQGNLNTEKAGALLAQIGATEEARPMLALAQQKAALAQHAGQAGASLAEQAQHNRAMEGLAREQFQAAQEGSKVPPGFTRTPEGGISFVPGGPADPSYIQQTTNAKTPEGALLTDAELVPMAHQVIQGDPSPFTNLGRGVQGAQNIVGLRRVVARLQAEKGITGEQQAGRNAEYKGDVRGQITLGNRAANIELPAAEFQQMVPLALQASEAVDRTQFPNLNAVSNALQKGTGGEAIVRFNAANNTLVNIYARAVSPTGVPTDEVRKKGFDILNTYFSKGQYGAAVDMMQQEIAAARRAPGAVRQQMRENFTGQPAQAAPEAPQQGMTRERAGQLLNSVRSSMQQRIQAGSDPQTELGLANDALRRAGLPPIMGP